MMNGDCMEFMRGLPDKAYDLAIVDPPYGIGDFNGTLSKVIHKPIEWNNAIPEKKYFDELYRISKNRIIWGANYYKKYIKDDGVIIHDKTDGGRIVFPASLSEVDYASHSFGVTMKIYRYGSKGNIDGKKINWVNTRIHPCQKPVALYKWLLSSYAKPGDKILDTHGGSGSICIACHDLGFDLDWIELDADYYAAACKRYKDHAAQGTLFAPEELRPTQTELFE